MARGGENKLVRKILSVKVQVCLAAGDKRAKEWPYRLYDRITIVRLYKPLNDPYPNQ